MVPASWRQPGRSGVQVDGQRLPSGHQWLHVGPDPAGLIRAPQSEYHSCIHVLFLLRYFRKGKYFGLACFANMPVESELERGARMKSVGILSPSYTLLYRYMHFLENQVRWGMLWLLFASTSAFLISPNFFCAKCSHELSMNPEPQLVSFSVTRTHWHAVFLQSLETKLEETLTASFLLCSITPLFLFSTFTITWLSPWRNIKRLQGFSFLPSALGNQTLKQCIRLVCSGWMFIFITKQALSCFMQYSWRVRVK